MGTNFEGFTGEVTLSNLLSINTPKYFTHVVSCNNVMNIERGQFSGTA